MTSDQCLAAITPAWPGRRVRVSLDRHRHLCRASSAQVSPAGYERIGRRAPCSHRDSGRIHGATASAPYTLQRPRRPLACVRIAHPVRPRPQGEAGRAIQARPRSGCGHDMFECRALPGAIATSEGPGAHPGTPPHPTPPHTTTTTTTRRLPFMQKLQRRPLKTSRSRCLHVPGRAPCDTFLVLVLVLASAVLSRLRCSRTAHTTTVATAPVSRGRTRPVSLAPGPPPPRTVAPAPPDRLTRGHVPVEAIIAPAVSGSAAAERRTACSRTPPPP